MPLLPLLHQGLHIGLFIDLFLLFFLSCVLSLVQLRFGDTACCATSIVTWFSRSKRQQESTSNRPRSPFISLCRLSSLVETQLLSFIYFDTRFWHLADRYCFENPSDFSIEPSQPHLDRNDLSNGERKQQVCASKCMSLRRRTYF